MIKLSNICKSYRYHGRQIQALRDVSLEVAPGSIQGVVGQSGAGKSTLIRCVNLLERPDSGSVVVNGKELTALSSRELLRARHEIGMIFQHFNLLSGRTVRENIALPLELMGTKRGAGAKLDKLLELTGLSDKANYYPSQLSGGQKQRVAIARALASEPQILLSDEATSALDPKTTDDILALLQQINEELGLTILLITHEMEVVKKICHRVALIEGGQLVECAEVERFFSQPQSELGKGFVAQIQHFELPKKVAARLQSTGRHPVIKLSFSGENIDTPLLSELARRFDIDVNIIQAKVEQIRNYSMGILLAELEGNPEQNAEALAYLRTQAVQLEVIGYVEPTTH